MIEVVRAYMRAGRLAEIAEFFSFGTNDLTQATFPFSREDAENRFLPLYEKHKILEDNPFEELDEKSVGRLMQMTIEWGRKSKPDLKIGICGEHGGQPQAIYFCNKVGVTYVSCSPLRIPSPVFRPPMPCWRTSRWIRAFRSRDQTFFLEPSTVILFKRRDKPL